MIKLLFSAFCTPRASVHAKRLLEQHQRALIEARRSAQYAVSNVTYHERVIADLQRTLRTEEA